jgi:hypothetical protein
VADLDRHENAAGIGYLPETAADEIFGPDPDIIIGCGLKARFQRVQPKRLSDKAVARVVKRRAAAVGLDPERYAGHSLCAGLATSAAAGGARGQLYAGMNRGATQSVTAALRNSTRVLLHYSRVVHRDALVERHPEITHRAGDRRVRDTGQITEL